MRVIVAALLVSFAAGCSQDADPSQGAPTEGPAPELLERITRPGEGGAVHLVRLVQRGDQYDFVPSAIGIRSGDVVRFVLDGPQPESVAFDTAAAAPDVAAYVRANSMHLGVLLVEPGQAWDVVFRDAPPGRYPFFSIPHNERGMRGVVEIPSS